jgi:predicted metalloendopeptidase
MERQLGTFTDPKRRFDRHKVVDEFSADLVGVQLALRAMASSQGASSSEPWRRKELRRFFLAYAQFFCPGLAHDVDADDEHPPASVRVNGVVANVPEFGAAFDCHAGARLAPSERVTLWQ